MQSGNRDLVMSQRVGMVGMILFLLLALPTIALAQDFMATGSYTGDGQSSKAITGLGFQPDVVMIKAINATAAVIRTVDMPAGYGKDLGRDNSIRTGFFSSLDVDGFTVGHRNEVNALGVEFFWVAMAARNGTLETGQYVGNGGYFQTISLQNMEPDAALIMAAESELPVYRHTDMGHFEGYALNGTGFVSSSFAFFGDNSISVLSGPTVNGDGKIYYYVAWKGETNVIDFGKYTGDGTDNREISGLNLNPAYILLANDTSEPPVQRPASVTGDLGLFFLPTDARNNLIQDMGSGSFQVGDDNSVNAVDNEYYWLAFANPSDQADLAVSVGADDSTPDPGQIIHLAINVDNQGPNDTTGVQLANTLPPGLTLQSSSLTQGTFDQGTGIWTIGPVNDGESQTLTLTVLVEASTAGQTLTDEASISATDVFDPNNSNDRNSIDISVLAPAGSDLEINLSADDETPDEGQAIVYLVSVINHGPDDATNIRITDQLPGSLTYSGSTPGQGTYDSGTGIWDLGNLAQGQTQTLTLNATVQSGTSGTVIDNTAAVTAADQTDPGAGNNSATVSLQVNSVDLQVIKLVNSTNADEGATVTYTILATNQGPGTATSVFIDDLLPAGVTFAAGTPSQGSYNSGTGVWNLGTLNNAQSENLVLAVTVDAGTSGNTITNTAQLNSVDQNDTEAANDSDSATFNVNLPASADLQLGQTLDNAAPNVGEIITYTVALQNSGPNDATGILVQDLLPAEVTFVSAMTNKGTFDDSSGDWSVGDLAQGYQAVLDIQARVLDAAIGTTVTNTAQISGADQVDQDTANNSASAEFNTPMADLALANNVDQPIPVVGDTVTFTLTLSNNGPNMASGIQVSDLLSQNTTLVSSTLDGGSFDEGTGIWSIPSLNPGLHQTLALATLVEPSAAGRISTNTANITHSDQADPVSSNNTGYTLITVAGADLALTMASNAAVALEGAQVELTLTAQNLGPYDATSVGITQLLPSGLTLIAATPERGTYDQDNGLWSLGSLDGSASSSLVLTAEVDSGTAGSNLICPASVTTSSPDDPDSDNNSTFVTIAVPDGLPTGNTLWPLIGTAGEALPGDAVQRPVLTFAFTNQSAESDTLHSVTVTNLTSGSGSPAQMDGEWQPLTLSYKLSMANQEIAPLHRVSREFTNGQAVFDDLEWSIAPNDTLIVILRGGPSLTVRDAAHLQVGVLSPEDLVFSQPYTMFLDWPLVSGEDLVVNGFSAAQAAVVPRESGLLAIGSVRNLALAVDLPGNGYLTDTLYGLSLKNNGSALPGSDISQMQLWADDGDHSFDPDLDLLLGAAIFSGDRWQLTGLSVPVPPAGRRFYATVDIAETAQPSSDIRLSLPVGNGPAVEMYSGNDGPVDLSLENPTTLGISVTDRIILSAEWFPSGIALPGTSEAPLLQLLLTNTYADERSLQALTFTNTTVAMDASDEQRDATCQQVHLILDANNNGELDDLTVDQQLASGIFAQGKAVFSGLDLSLAPDGPTRLFVTVDLGLNTVADGNLIKGELQSMADISIPGATIVASWPLASDAQWLVNGMIAGQIDNQDISVLTLGPGEGPILALDLTIPANGYRADELLGLALENEGSATSDDLAAAELWVDGGDGVFNAGLGDDLSLGLFAVNGRHWNSTVLSQDIPVGGSHLFASITVADSPQDSVTVKLGLPLGGVTVSSGNDGPLDNPVPGLGNLVISTSPLRTSVSFASAATNTGQDGTITMSILNAGSDTVTDILPVLNFLSGEGLLSLFAPSPSSIESLAPGAEASFTWQYQSNAPGEVRMAGNAQGVVNGIQVRRSIITPTGSHQIYTPVPELELYPTANLPFSLNRGQQGVAPLTLTLFNTGESTVADAHLTSLRLRLLESTDGPGIVPAELLDSVVLAEGTNTYFSSQSLPGEGDQIDLVFSHPVVITGSEPVTLGLRLDLRLNSTVPSFLISIEDPGWLVGSDSVDGSAVTVVPGEGSFPVSTGQAILVSQAVGLEVAVQDPQPSTTIPGQTDILLGEIRLSQSDVGDNSSSIDLGRLAFKFHDAAGAPLPVPDQYFSRLSLQSTFQEHFSGTPVVQADSLVVIDLSAPVTITGNAELVLRLMADMNPNCPLGQVTPLVGSVDYFDARDGNMNNPVPVVLTTDPAGPVLDVLAPASILTADGTALLPEQISQGARDLVAMDLTLTNPGDLQTTAAFCDTLVLGFFDAARQPLDTALYLDRLRVRQGDTDLGILVDPAATAGFVPVPLSGLELPPGQGVTLEISLDLKSEAISGTMEVVVENSGIRAFDAVSHLPVAVVPAAGSSLPLSSGVATLVAPADELTVSAENLMPPLLAPGTQAYPVLSLVLTNTATAGSDVIQIQHISLTQEAAKSENPALGQLLKTVRLRQGDLTLAETSILDPGSTLVTLTPVSNLVVEAQQNLDLVLDVLLQDDAPDGALRLSLAEDGISAAAPHESDLAVRILPASGQTFPFLTEIGNIGAATLAESYANFPNPFAAGREQTTFAFSLLMDARVDLKIMTPHGDLVATILQDESRGAGFYQDDTWPGLNGNGSPVHNGVYLAELVVRYNDGHGERIVRKVAVVR